MEILIVWETGVGSHLVDDVFDIRSSVYAVDGQ